MTIEDIAMVIGLGAILVLLTMIVWSICNPARRIWPPNRSTPWKQVGVWSLAIAMFCSAFVVGVLGWNSLQLPAQIRWSVGLPLIIAGHLVVWGGVLQLGMKVTSGQVGVLKTNGFYRYSRNPQYVADIGILIGWAILSGSVQTLPIVALGAMLLVIAPFAEEPWLNSVYGEAYELYCQTTRRFL